MNIGFTGHRDTLGSVDFLVELNDLYPNATWIHGGAQGFDTQVNEFALKVGKVLNETLIVIRPEYDKHPKGFAPIARNMIIVDRCDLLIACYDGRGRGGTFRTILYARKLGKPIENCYRKEED